MCGIFAYIGNQLDAPDVVLSGIKLLEYRGYDSWGVAYIPDLSDEIIIEKHIGKIGEAKLKKHQLSKIAFGHTRWATHGGVTDVNAHPHLDCNNQIAVIHNGIVENYQDIKKMLFSKKHVFKSETDTEVISHLIEENMKKYNFKDAVLFTFKSLIGSNAICVLDLKSKSVVACRDGSPLVAGYDEINKQFFLASDVPAFLKFTNEVYFVKNGESAEVTRNGIKIYDTKSMKEIKIKKDKLDWKLDDAKKNGYPHFLLKEIMEQPSTILKTSKINIKEIKNLTGIIKQSKNVILIGCGTASYCALSSKYFLADVGVNTQFYGAYEFIPFAKFCSKETLVIAISQSGETADTLIALKEAKKHGARTAAILNARGSTMERLVDIAIPVGAGPEIAVVSTKAFTSQLATMYLISKMVEGKYTKGVKEIENLSRLLKKWLNKKLQDKIVDLAKRISDAEHMYIIGKHINFPGALEFGLKIKETSYIHAESFTAGELKHGVITLIQKGTPCFILVNNDLMKNEVLSSAAELKARGGYIIGISPFKSTEFDELILTPDLGELTVFGNIIAGQLLGYYLGIGRGADPDKPRNLAKSVTVK